MKYKRSKIVSKQDIGDNVTLRFDNDLSFYLGSKYEFANKNVGDIAAYYILPNDVRVHSQVYTPVQLDKPRRTILSVIAKNLHAPLDKVTAMWHQSMSYDAVITELMIKKKNK